ncbi:MAG TPA: TlpA disulfide reductase family protein [Bacteroidales bacterium]|nr:TlpA disulfide reductase family protein [Bacteroidales bacterium]
MLNRFFPAAVIILFLAGCTGNKSFRIDGVTKSHPGEYVSISLLDVNTPVYIDSTKIRSDGSFRFRVKCNLPEFYEISLPGQDFITVLAAPGDKIHLKFQGKNLSDGFTVSGSPETAKLVTLDSALAVTRQKVAELRKEYNDTINKTGFKVRQNEIQTEYVKLLKDQRIYNIGFILKNLRSFTSIKALYQMIDGDTYVLYDTRDLQYLKIVSDTLTSLYPASKQAKSLKADFEKEYAESKAQSARNLFNSLPATKLDPNLMDINGKRIALSSLKGKYVLLAFWSASSSECISENLQLKELYGKYRKKGFEIYQVNLDPDEKTWKKAVKFDELPWINVREDDPQNPKYAVIYNVQSLPANYLYDKSGNIIGSGFHDRNLQVKLSQLFGN